MIEEEELSHVSLLLEFDFSLLCSLGHHVLVLNTHNTTTPVSSELFIVVELSSEVLGQHFQVLEVFLSNVGQSDAGGSLLVDELAESSLTLDEGVGNSLLSEESWEERHEFNWVNVVSNNDELCLAFFNQGGHVVKTKLDVVWLTSLLWVSTTGLSFSFLLKSGLLFLLSLWFVFCK